MYYHAREICLNLFIWQKRFKESYKTSVNLEDLNVYFVLYHFNLFLFVNKTDEESESYLIEEEDSNELLENFIVVHS